MAHVRLVLDQLARLHSASYHFLQTFGVEEFKREFPVFVHDLWIPNGGSEAMDKTFEGVLASSYGSFVTAMESFLDREEFPDLPLKLKQFDKVRVETAKRAHRTEQGEGSFNCILHNDAWCNNFMFK